jgi:hypothetical protein
LCALFRTSISRLPPNFRGRAAAQLLLRADRLLFQAHMCIVSGQQGLPGVSLRNNREFAWWHSDKTFVRFKMQQLNSTAEVNIPWAMQVRAISMEEPARLVQALTGAILGCGGWVLSRGASDSGTVNMLFEFERRTCIDIYSVLIGAGLELSQSSHVHFTELCQCTRNHLRECGTDLASVDLEIRTFPIEAIACAAAPGIA